MSSQKRANAPIVRSPQQPPLSDSTIQRLLAVQESKIQLELKQTEIALREIDHNQQIADKSIQAQAEDRKDERAIAKAMHLHRLVFMGVIVLLVVLFACIALYLNKDEIVLDMVKVIFGFVGGWGASLAWQRRHKSLIQEGGPSES